MVRHNYSIVGRDRQSDDISDRGRCAANETDSTGGRFVFQLVSPTCAEERSKMYDPDPRGMADGVNREQISYTCSTCGSLLDKRGSCSHCLNKALLAKRLRIKQKVQDLFREIDRLVAKGW
jgi:uncharacterized C2H2 Zn-finger protein